MATNIRSSKSFKNLGTFSKEILVQCPQCKRKAHVFAVPRYTVPYPTLYDAPTFRCSNCSKMLEKHSWFGPSVIWPGNNRCGKCACTLGEKRKVSKFPAIIKATCSNCGYEQLYETSYSRTYASDTQATDPYYGLELWLQIPFDNKILWAYNYDHLEYLKEYVGAKLREATTGGKQALYWRLPKFIKTAKNRERLIKVIEKLEKR